VLDHGSHREFYEYYAEQSASPETRDRFLGVQRAVLRVLGSRGRDVALDVADIGCGAGAQCLLWAESGHRVHGLDVNQPLLKLARERAERAGVVVDFHLGTATALPWASSSLDVVLLPELLEHVEEWRPCLSEAVRVLRPGGLLFVSTTNVLCPVQQEFTLPLYSWYPTWLKRWFVRLSRTTRPEFVRHAKYPAIHWFSFYSLRSELGRWRIKCLDRFDAMDLSGRSSAARCVVRLIRAVPPIRFMGHVLTPYTTVLGLKESGGNEVLDPSR
jgi:2-polyprenyl-6-hydroxyphenyl methylase/3-demethylubiquinone-9 3-methyltransferase